MLWTILISLAYVVLGLTIAKYQYKHAKWACFNSDNDNAAFSLLQGLIWPGILAALILRLYIQAPSVKEARIQRKTDQESAARKRKAQLAHEIQLAEQRLAEVTKELTK
jgi:hypothetical protein